MAPRNDAGPDVGTQAGTRAVEVRGDGGQENSSNRSAAMILPAASIRAR
jgi:hypothetical protein